MLFEQQQFAYDSNGNQLLTTRTTFTDGIPGAPVVTQQNTYDLRNQLIRTVTENGTIVENVYNGDGLRVEKIVNGTATFYLYEYQRVVLEQNSLGDVTGRNIYGTNLLMRTVGVDAFFYMYNAHADVTALLSTSGTIIGTYYYDAFGNILEQTGSAGNSILFAGYQYDKETGMYYLNARMYDPVTARFMQEDTYNGQYNDPLSLNLYTYCHNEPLMYSDPTGHTPAGYETFTPPKKPEWMPASAYPDYVAAAKKDWEFKNLKALKPYMPDEAFEEQAAKLGYETVRPEEKTTKYVIGEKTITAEAKPSEGTPSGTYLEYEREIDVRIEAGEDVQKQAWIQPSGWELAYEPEAWNDMMTSMFFGDTVNENSIQLGTNCYGYAINQKEEGNAKFNWLKFNFNLGSTKTQPGYLSGNTESDIVDRVTDDLNVLGMDFNPIEKNEPCSDGGYKVALVLSDGDYHWYRQNPDGTWSHKQGQGEVHNTDAAGDIIYDPESCDRDYRDIINNPMDYYSTFVGFYEVVP